MGGLIGGLIGLISGLIGLIGGLIGLISGLTYCPIIHRGQKQRKRGQNRRHYFQK